MVSILIIIYSLCKFLIKLWIRLLIMKGIQITAKNQLLATYTQQKLSHLIKIIYCCFPVPYIARNRPKNNKRSLRGYEVPETKEEMMKENEEKGRGVEGGELAERRGDK